MADDRFPGWHGTTILAVRRGGEVVVAGDGQVSLGQTVIKGSARKVRRLSPGGQDVVAGFPDRPPTRLPCWNGWRKSWKPHQASWPAPASIWPRTGGWTSICAILRRC